MKEKLVNIGIPVILLLLIVSLVVAAIMKHDAQEKDAAIAVTVPVELKASSSVRGQSVGLIVTIGNEGAAGSEWNQAASGAAVAIERFNRSGLNLSLLTEDDRGTSEGAVRAVEALAEHNVSGIVIASRGDHVQDAVKAATDLGIPVILPYEDALQDAWSLKPSPDALRELLVNHNAGVSRVVRVDQEGFTGIDVPAEDTLAMNGATDVAKLAQDIAQRTEDAGGSAAVVLNTDAYMQARLARALQEAGVNAQIILGSEATSPTFSEEYMQDNQSAVINAVSLGFDTGDSIALQSDGQGRSMSAYLQMVKILNDSPEAAGVLDDQKFSDVAVNADSRSHDAVVAMVRAMESAGSSDPQDVKESLGSLTLSPSDGITAPAFDFSQQYAVQSSPVMLSSAIGDIEMRSSLGNETSRIVWFAAS